MVRATHAPTIDRSFVLDVLARTVAREAEALAFPTVAGRLRPPARAFVFGGVLRNAVLSALRQERLPWRDVDYVVFGLDSDDELYEAFAPDHPRRNSFGGLKLELGGTTIDIWRAELQATIAGQASRVVEPEEFLPCVTLTVDAVLYDPRAATLYEQGFVHALRERTIETGRDSRWIEPWVPYHLAHLAYVRELTGFAIGPGAAACVRTAGSAAVVEAAVRYLESKGTCPHPRDTVASLVAEARTGRGASWTKS